MKIQLGMLILGVGLAAACNRGEELRRDQQQYEVVQEGAGGAVTSTIHAPGEIMPPLTNTNADTTSAFTLPNVTDTTQSPAPPGSLAETFPTEPAWSPPRQPAPRRTPAPQPQPAAPSEPERVPESQPVPEREEPRPEPVEEEPVPAPERDPEPQPEPQPPPPPTETQPETAPTDTAAP